MFYLYLGGVKAWVASLSGKSALVTKPLPLEAEVWEEFPIEARANRPAIWLNRCVNCVEIPALSQ
jgi:hypothetical protein